MRKEAIEEKIKGFKAKHAETVRRKADFDNECAQLAQEVIRLEGHIRMYSGEKDQVDRRLLELQTGTFNGMCPKCRGVILEKHLKANPLMRFCIGCQKEVNNSRR